MAIQTTTLQERAARNTVLDRAVISFRRVQSRTVAPFAVLVSALLLVYLGTNFGWFLWTVRSATANTYVLQPFIWTAMGVGVLYIHRTRGIRLMVGVQRIPTALLIGLFQVSVLIIVGLMFGFANSPYSHQVPNLALNTVFLGTSLVGMELARNLLLRCWGEKDPRLAAWTVGLLFGLMSVPLTQLTTMQGPERTVHVLGTLVVPELTVHVLATYLALKGGLLPALTYRAVLTGFEWYSPILPDTTGFMSALVAFAVAYVGYRTFESVLGAEKRVAEPVPMIKTTRWKRAARYGWPAATFISVAVIWFSMGLFPYKPTSVLGESMSPAHERGDMLILRSIEPDELQVGDVIEYRIGSIAVVHRIIDVDRSPAALLFVTKGDNNEIPDPAPVAPSQVTGKLVFEVPKAGWPGIWVKQAVGFLVDGI